MVVWRDPVHCFSAVAADMLWSPHGMQAIHARTSRALQIDAESGSAGLVELNQAARYSFWQGLRVYAGVQCKH